MATSMPSFLASASYSRRLSGVVLPGSASTTLSTSKPAALSPLT